MSATLVLGAVALLAAAFMVLVADKTRAEAMMKAAETGQVKVIVMNGNQTAVSVGAEE